MTETTDGPAYSVFAETMADMTYPEVEEAARDGAILLWSLGVIEQHGPHLPLATDVYVPMAVLREARRLLAERAIASLIIPPFYWGVNVVSAHFPGSFKVRPEIMVGLLSDVFQSLEGDGFRRLFLLSGHGDARHNRAILDAVEGSRQQSGIAVRILAPASLPPRLGADPASPAYCIVEPHDPVRPFIDAHAGEDETSILLAATPKLCRTDVIPDLASTDLGPGDLAVWRQGYEHSRRVTPNGYFGDPAAASAEQGHGYISRRAGAIADAIAAAIDGEIPPSGGRSRPA